MRVKVETTIDGRAGIVAADGEIDLASTPRLREALSDHLAAGRTHLLINLCEVTFMDSTGLGVLVGAGKKATGLGGSLRIVCDNPRLLRLLAITGISRSLPVLSTVDEALVDWPVGAT
jgi:anti-sigma B factor antagonist